MNDMNNIIEAISWKPFIEELRHILNSNNIDGLTNTPDYILAEMIAGYIIVHATATNQRDKHFEFDLKKALYLETEEPSMQDKYIGGVRV